MKISLLPLLFLFSIPSFAADAGLDEATFINTTDQDLFCYGDAGETGYICQIKAAPGEICRGDAMGGDFDTTVYKAPNKTQWSCHLNKENQVDCSAKTVKSSLMIIAATAANGLKNYFKLDWKDWVDVMGHRPFRKCDQNYRPISNEVWVPLGDEGKCHLKTESSL